HDSIPRAARAELNPVGSAAAADPTGFSSARAARGMESCKDEQMNSGLDDSITASFLESGWTLARASHTAALVAGIGSAAAHSTVQRIVFSGSLVWWLVMCWFAVRVTIDASLFRHL